MRLRLPEKVHRVVQLPGDRPVPHTEKDGVVRFTVPRLETLAMFGGDPRGGPPGPDPGSRSGPGGPSYRDTPCSS